MPPKETSPFLPSKNSSKREESDLQCSKNKTVISVGIGMAFLWLLLWRASHNYVQTGPYRLVELQEGNKFFEFYDFYDGPDSIGSAGYNTYISQKRAQTLGLANVTTDSETGIDYIYMKSAPGVDGGFRESIRLHGKRRFDRGLFILDVAHMPTGCGVWPAWWLTDEKAWPDNGEIDILEGINTQSVAKTALHTSEDCSMYAHVSDYFKTGTWDGATGIPDTFTGKPNYRNKVEADNCWVEAPHQWSNQGCVAVSSDNGTIGEPMNDIGGGIYVLEWDPANGYIKSWVFKRDSIPENLEEAIDTASNYRNKVLPEPDTWDLPYAYFAIGEGSGCAEDHFKNNRLIFNLAFCGQVAGNRFFKDCPALSETFKVQNDSVLSCNAYLESEPEALTEAYWKIRGVYVYEREWEIELPKVDDEETDDDSESDEETDDDY